MPPTTRCTDTRRAASSMATTIATAARHFTSPLPRPAWPSGQTGPRTALRQTSPVAPLRARRPAVPSARLSRVSTMRAAKLAGWLSVWRYALPS
jgi:hypothetical protein